MLPPEFGLRRKRAIRGALASPAERGIDQKGPITYINKEDLSFMKIKKFLALGLALLMLFSLAACNSTEKNSRARTRRNSRLNTRA